eukprot:TRINITY_DN37525_c0_g1_i1.p1 TRINITY_DN37525_c0_g1~~TRINITY_DN37525_c0_g1_i1.p1  ORF type:complete len:274 (-),score=60.52 TRINITY_DN37525_c0_g1_i1:971-1792(-)
MAHSLLARLGRPIGRATWSAQVATSRPSPLTTLTVDATSSLRTGLGLNTTSAQFPTHAVRFPAKSTKVPVRLCVDIDGTGRAGEVVWVRRGYMRNYLLPKKLATFDRQRSVRHKFIPIIEEKIRREAPAHPRTGPILPEQFELTVHRRMRNREHGTLQRAITKQGMSDIIVKQRDVLVSPDNLDFGEDLDRITSLGKYRIKAKLNGGDICTITLHVQDGTDVIQQRIDDAVAKMNAKNQRTFELKMQEAIKKRDKEIQRLLALQRERDAAKNA